MIYIIDCAHNLKCYNNYYVVSNENVLIKPDVTNMFVIYLVVMIDML